MSFPREYDSLFKVYPYSCVFSCTTVRQRNDILGNDTWSEMGKILSSIYDLRYTVDKSVLYFQSDNVFWCIHFCRLYILFTREVMEVPGPKLSQEVARNHFRDLVLGIEYREYNLEAIVVLISGLAPIPSA